MSELIYRQDVIARLKKAEYVFRQNGAELEATGIHYALELVESYYEIPTIEPRKERPQGKWVIEGKPFDDGLGDSVLVMTCSICKKSFVYRGTTSNYCPNCGADMRGDSHGQ